MHSGHFIEICDLFFFFFQLGGMWDLSSPSRDQTQASCIGSAVLRSRPPGKSQCVVCWVWFLSLSVVFLRLIHFIICINSSLVWMINTLLHIYMYFVYPLSHWWASRLFPPSGYCEQCAAMNILMQVFNYLFSTLLDIYPRVEFLGHCSLKSCLTLWPHGLQHAGLPCPPLSPRVCSNSCPLSRWCHPTISSTVTPLSSYPQSVPASGSFLMSQFFESGGQRIGGSASVSVLLMNIMCWFPLGLTGLISLQSKEIIYMKEVLCLSH